jgi:hypothetical protein
MWYKKLMLLMLSVRQALSASVDSLVNSAQSVVFFKTINAPLFDEGTFFLIQSYALQGNHTVCLNTSSVIKKLDWCGVGIEPQNVSWALRGDEFRWCDSIARMARTPWVIYNGCGSSKMNSAVTLRFNLSNQTREITAKFLISTYSSWGRPYMLWDAKPSKPYDPPPSIRYYWVRLRNRVNANVSMSVKFRDSVVIGPSYQNNNMRYESVSVSARYGLDHSKSSLPVVKYSDSQSEFNLQLAVTLPPFDSRHSFQNERLSLSFTGLDAYRRVLRTDEDALVFSIMTLDYVTPKKYEEEFTARTKQRYKGFPEAFLQAVSGSNLVPITLAGGRNAIVIKEYVSKKLSRTYRFRDSSRAYFFFKRSHFSVFCQDDSVPGYEVERSLSVTLDLSPRSYILTRRIINRLPQEEYIFWSTRYRVKENRHALVSRTPLRNDADRRHPFLPIFSLTLSFSSYPNDIRLAGGAEHRLRVHEGALDGLAQNIRIQLIGSWFSFSQPVTIEYQLCGQWYAQQVVLPETMLYSFMPVVFFLMAVYSTLLHEKLLLMNHIFLGRMPASSALFSAFIYKKTLPGESVKLALVDAKTQLHQLLEVEVGLFFKVIEFLSPTDVIATLNVISVRPRLCNVFVFNQCLVAYFKSYLSLDSKNPHFTLNELIVLIEAANPRARGVLFSVLLDKGSCFAVVRSNGLIISNELITRLFNITRVLNVLFLMLGISFFTPSTPSWLGFERDSKQADRHYLSPLMAGPYVFILMAFPMFFVMITVSAIPCLRHRAYRSRWCEGAPPHAPRPITLRQSRSTAFYADKALTSQLIALLVNMDPHRRTMFKSIRDVQGLGFFTRQYNRSQPPSHAHRTIDIGNSPSSGNDSDLDLSLETPLLQGSMSA